MFDDTIHIYYPRYNSSNYGALDFYPVPLSVYDAMYHVTI